MGVLESQGRRYMLSGDVLVGREPTAALRLADDSVSWRHASLRWTGRVWELQDLGSMNGTFVDAERIAPGQRVAIRIGTRITFGTHEWTLVDAGPPPTSVVDIESGERLFAEDGLIAIPSGDQPDISLFQGADGSWVAEGQNGSWQPSAMEVLSAGTRRFRFEPGDVVAATSASQRDQVTPATVTLEFVVSRDEEHVDLTVSHPTRRIELRPRAHTYLLLTLARLRVQDQSNQGLPPTSHGWVHQEKLVKMLATNPTQLAVDICRARRQFGDSGIANAPQIIERRLTSHELRIGAANLSIRVA